MAMNEGNGGEGIDEKEDRTESEQRKAHDGRMAQLIESCRGRIGPKYDEHDHERLQGFKSRNGFVAMRILDGLVSFAEDKASRKSGGAGGVNFADNIGEEDRLGRSNL